MKYLAILLSAFLALVFVSCTNDATGPGSGEPKSGRIFYSVLQSDGRNGTLYSINADGTEKNKLHDNMVLYSAPAAGRMAALRMNPGNQEIVLLDINGNELLTVPAVEGGSNPILSPKGDRILYSVYRLGSTPNGDANELHCIDTDGANDIILEAASALETFPVFSPDGKKVAFMKYGWLGTNRWLDSLFVVNIDGTGRQLLSANARARFDKVECASWSPDGSQLVAITEEANSIFNLFTVGVDGRELRQITHDDAPRFMPAWSPDGKKIACIAVKNWESPEGSLLLMNTDGTGRTESHVSTTEVLGFPRWSTDGKDILVIGITNGNLPSGTLKLIDVDTDNAVVLDNNVFRGYWYTE